MASTKPEIVLIHGGWHVPETYAKFTGALESAGYSVHVPRLPSMNETRPPNADLATDSAFIRAYVEELVHKESSIVVVMHSYGGQVGTNALVGLELQPGKKGGIVHLIYVCAFALPEGGSMVGKVKEFGHEHLIPVAFDFAEDNSCLNRDPKTLLIGPGVDDAEVNKYLSTLVRWNGKSMYDEIEHCAWREIPATYVYTSADMTVPHDYQKSMVDKMKAEGRRVDTVELATGHCPNLTRTAELVDVVNGVAVKTEKL